MILEPIQLYCGRTGPGLLAEPLNVAASFIYLWLAVVLWRRSQQLWLLRQMAVLMALLCVAAVWLHILPSDAALAANLIVILGLVLVYFHAVNRDLVGLSPGVSVAAAAMILPFLAASLPLVALLPGAGGSAAYAVLPILLLGYAAVLRQTCPRTARGLLVAALILAVAIGFRTVDMPLCGVWPYGTHFLWILGIAALVWQLAQVYRRHMLAGPDGGG